MKKLLIYGNRKQEEMIFDISTPDKETLAYATLFTILDQEWNVYIGLTKKETDLYKLAKNGDCLAAKKLLTLRKDNEYEYEEFHFGELIDATNYE